MIDERLAEQIREIVRTELTPMRGQLDGLRNEVTPMRAQLDELRAEIAPMRAQLDGLPLLLRRLILIEQEVRALRAEFSDFA
jgi:hypothetical protein